MIYLNFHTVNRKLQGVHIMDVTHRKIWIFFNFWGPSLIGWTLGQPWRAGAGMLYGCKLSLTLLVWWHNSDVIMIAIAFQITSVSVVSSTVCSGVDQNHQGSVSLAFVRGIHQSPVDSPHKGPVTRKAFPFDDVIMTGVLAETSCIMGSSDLHSTVSSIHQFISVHIVFH